MTETQTALICMTAVMLAAIILKIDGAKEISLALGGAIGGWMARGKAETQA